ncbi:hypothetical protein QBC38DRAFT_253086 [Podospora fimiseda]|uniref:Transcription factor domain-containing protein n=1 Tax=Podospora fimiseda TaxID=252190 RepID=A0AAN7BMK7_9PEZI|nr:hypothetical protein QBC38DRAFT_253086 [Podospora fimiseda]
MEKEDDGNSDTISTGGGMPAPYGRACTNCAKAKCRCIYRTTGTGCERLNGRDGSTRDSGKSCHRLKKECVPSVSVRKRNGKRAHVSRAAQLEAKIEDLVTLLQRQAAPGASDLRVSSPAEPPAGTSIPSATPTLSGGHSTTSQSGDSPPRAPPAPVVVLTRQMPECTGLVAQAGTLLGEVFPPDDHPRHHAVPQMAPPSTYSASLPPCNYIPNPLEAAESLVTFRKYMLIFLPFLHLPPSVTEDRLREMYPFLWFCIMTVTCKNADNRVMMSEAVKKFIAQKMVVDHEKNLDLLLALLVILGWSHHYVRKERPILCVMASLAKSLVFDLGLNKIPCEPYIAYCLRTPFNPAPREKTQDERRAVLACFLVTSQVSHSLKRLDALNWTPHMDECLLQLSQRREWEGDDLLVAQVKVQLIVEQLNRFTAQSPDNTPPYYYVSALHTQLQTIKAQLPHHLQTNDTLLSIISYTELAIHEITFTKPRGMPNTVIPDMQRYEAMESCLSALKSWFTRHFSIPSYVYVGMTFTYWCNLAHCLLALYRLSVLEDPAWDRRAVRNKIDLIQICERLKIGFEEIATKTMRDSGPTVEEDGFCMFSKMLTRVGDAWSAELNAINGNSMPNGGNHHGGSMPVQDPYMNGPAVDPQHAAVLMNIPLLQFDDSETWMAGLFDINWVVDP